MGNNASCKFCLYHQGVVKIFLYKPYTPKVFFQFEIILNVLVSSIRSIWIYMLWIDLNVRILRP